MPSFPASDTKARIAMSGGPGFFRERPKLFFYNRQKAYRRSGKERTLFGQFTTQFPHRMQSALLTLPMSRMLPGLVSMGQTFSHKPHSRHPSPTCNR